MNIWVGAAIAIAGGLVLGTILGRIVQGLMSRESRPEAVRSVAAPMGSLVFSILLIAGLMTALGMVQQESLDQISTDFVTFLPKVISAAIVVIAANVVGSLAQTALERALSRLPGSAAKNIPNITRLVILTFGGILAAAQLGIDTTIINIAVAAVLFSLGLATALMVGLGSFNVTGEVAAGRAVRRLVSPGDEIRMGDLAGTIVGIDTVAVEVVDTRGVSLMIPHSMFTSRTFEVTRSAAPVDGDGAAGATA